MAIQNIMQFVKGQTYPETRRLQRGGADINLGDATVYFMVENEAGDAALVDVECTIPDAAGGQITWTPIGAEFDSVTFTDAQAKSLRANYRIEDGSSIEYVPRCGGIAYLYPSIPRV